MAMFVTLFEVGNQFLVNFKEHHTRNPTTGAETKSPAKRAGEMWGKNEDRGSGRMWDEENSGWPRDWIWGWI
jgi:hypothetical protein